MDQIVSGLGQGLEVALTLKNLGFCFIGVLVGTAIGVLPGVGPVPTIALLLPVTFALKPDAALIMLAGIYYGAQYGGSTTAILCNMPGESSSVVTCIDGHQMAKNGEAGTALAIAAIGSFVAGTIATFAVAFAGPPLAIVAASFGAADYFALMVLGPILAVILARGSVLKAVAMTVLGLLLGLAGTDVTTGAEGLTFGIPVLADGIGFVPVAMGLFGIAEIVSNLERETARSVVAQKLHGLLPRLGLLRKLLPAMLRGTGIGTVLGILPGGGALLSSFAAYGVEKRLSKEPQRFGRGAPEGVAAPEAANNAGAQTSFIPLLTLGIPGNPVMALMAGALIIQGIAPGPNLVRQQPELFWGVIASMWIGNIMLVVLNLPLIGLWVRLLSVPYRFLFPAIVVFGCIGCYSVANSVFDVLFMLLFGLVGYVLLKANAIRRRSCSASCSAR